MAEPVFCTKIASRLTRTYTDRHGLKDICAELIGVNLSKIQQSSDWGADQLTPEQIEYAASDVLYLPHCGTRSRRGSRATVVLARPRPASASCRRGPGST